MDFNREPFFDQPSDAQSSPGSEPRAFRRVIDVIVTRDLITGEEIRLPIGGTESVIHPDGCTDQYRMTTGDTWPCGHPLSVPFGGQCYESKKLVCAACLVQCAICSKPLSREYAHIVDEYFLCKQHAGEIRRGRLLRRIAHAILRPFVDFDGGHRG